MACIREQTFEDRRGTIPCDEEGCEFAWFKVGSYPQVAKYPPEIDCVLQLRLRAIHPEIDELREYLEEELRRGLEENRRWLESRGVERPQNPTDSAEGEGGVSG